MTESSDTPTIPVVCIHGALRSRAGMWPTAVFLRRLGFDARTFGYATRTGTIDEHGRRLAAFLEGWLGEPRRAPLVGFVTHSMGALVVRAYLGQTPPDPGGPARRIVMLSPPNQGSQLARKQQTNPAFHWLYGTAAAELASEVPASMPGLPPTVDALVLAGGTGGAGYNPLIEGDDDGMVAVDEMGLPGIDPVLVGGVHALLQWRPDVLRRAAAFIRTGLDQGPSKPEAPVSE